MSTLTIPTQPLGSPIVLERYADGLTLKLAALGLRRGGGFMFWWMLLWNAVAVPITASLSYTALIGGEVIVNDQPGGSRWWCLMFIPFFFVGVVSLLIVLYLGRRRAALAVVGGRLFALRVGLFHTERGEWARDELADVRVGPCSAKVNDIPVLELQILPKKGAKFALLAGRAEVELKWMAAILKQALTK
jgi:hypothetical protein